MQNGFMQDINIFQKFVKLKAEIEIKERFNIYVKYHESRVSENIGLENINRVSNKNFVAISSLLALKRYI